MPKKHIGVNEFGIVKVSSIYPIKVHGLKMDIINGQDNVIGARLFYGELMNNNLKVAIICNWKDKCGISTYTEYLTKALSGKVKQIKIFSEENSTKEADVEYCWKRGESMRATIEKIIAWKADFVIIQHEFGIFPNAFYYMQMIQLLDNIPYIVIMHSVYDHLDKAICSGVTRNIGVHTKQGAELLKNLGSLGEVFTIPHGCISFGEPNKLWNLFQNPYTIFQFGFGFRYKGIDRSLDAIHHLKETDPKFKNIFYCCFISTNDHNSAIHDEYYQSLMKQVEDLGLQENVTFQRGFFSEDTINYMLRTAKIAIFPYKTDPHNTVYGASGAIRIAMANNIPIVASESHLFDDLEGIVPRPSTHLLLAKEIDEIFSNDTYRQSILDKTKEFLVKNSWDNVADRYLEIYQQIIKKINNNSISIN